MLLRGMGIVRACVIAAVCGAFVCGARGQGAAVEHGDLVALLKENVFRIKVLDADGKAVSSGSGFFLRREGAGEAIAVTNYHVVRRASSARAALMPDGAEFPVSLLATLPGHDQALVRVELSGSGIEPRGLEVAAALPLEGTNVWAVGYPGSLGFTMTRGVISGVRRWENLKQTTRARYDDGCVWLQIDAAINSGSSGGPVVDASGRVLGISTWSYVDGDALNFASSATHVSELLGRVGDAPIAFPAESKDADEGRATGSGAGKPEPARPESGNPSQGQLFPSGARRPVPSVPPASEVSPGSMPDLTGLRFAEVEESGSAGDLLARAQSLRARMVCVGCDGKGTVTVRRKIGERKSGGRIFPIMENATERCGTCRGRRVGTFEEAETALGHLARQASGTRVDGANDLARLELACAAIRDAVTVAGEVHPAVRGGRLLTLVGAKEGDRIATWFEGDVVTVERAGRIGERSAVLVRARPGDRYVLVTDPLIRQGRVGSRVLVFGVCVGQHMDQGRRYPVVQGALMVAY